MLRTSATILLWCSVLHAWANPPAGKHGPVNLLNLLHPYDENEPLVEATESSCIIPFTRAGNLILIQAKADSTEGNFILDTGAPGLVLNITYFRQYPVTYQHDAEETSITGTSSSVSKTTIDSLRLGTIHYHKLEADLANLGPLENSKSIKIIGLLGMALFRNCEMIIDYEKNEIHLHLISKKESSTYCHEMLKDTSQYNTIPVDLMDNRIVAKTEVAGKKLKLVIDCGAETNLLDSRLPDRVFEEVSVTKRVTLSGTGTNKVEALYGLLSSMTIGPRKIPDMPVLITNLEKTCFSYMGCIDGILGFDFLSLHKIGFNFVNRKMYIWK